MQRKDILRRLSVMACLAEVDTKLSVANADRIARLSQIAEKPNLEDTDVRFLTELKVEDHSIETIFEKAKEIWGTESYR